MIMAVTVNLNMDMDMNMNMNMNIQVECMEGDTGDFPLDDVGVEGMCNTGGSKKLRMKSAVGSLPYSAPEVYYAKSLLGNQVCVCSFSSQHAHTLTRPHPSFFFLSSS